jgi:hypothetical protein
VGDLSRCSRADAEPADGAVGWFWFWFRVAVVPASIDRFGHDPVPVPGRGGEHPVVGDEFLPRPRDQRAEAFDQRVRGEDDVGGAVAVAALELVEQGAVVR